MIYAILIINSIVVGGFSAYVAEQKNRSGLNWFILGAAFSVFALIALIAIPKLDKESNQSQKQSEDISQFNGEPDIKSEAYQLYLTRKFNIERNIVLEKYVVKDKIFSTLEDALKYADILNKELENNLKLKKLKELEDESNRLIELEKMKIQEKKGMIILVLFIFFITSIAYFLGKQ